MALDDAGLPRVLLGVGNKGSDYDSDDVSVAQQVVDAVWVVVSRNRAHQHVASRLALLAERQESARVCTWEWDPVTGRVSWDSSTGHCSASSSAARRGPGTGCSSPAPGVPVAPPALDKGPDGGPLDLELRGSQAAAPSPLASGAAGWCGRRVTTS